MSDVVDVEVVDVVEAISVTVTMTQSTAVLPLPSNSTKVKLYIPAGSQEPKTMCDLSCSPEPVQDLAFLADQPGQSQFLERGGPKMRRYQSGKVL